MDAIKLMLNLTDEKIEEMLFLQSFLLILFIMKYLWYIINIIIFILRNIKGVINKG